MSAPQDNDQPISDPNEEPVRTFDLDSGEVTTDEDPTRDSEGPADHTTVEVQPPPPNTPGESNPSTQLAPAKSGWLGRIMRPRNRREQQLQTLQSGYLEMLEMMRSIRTHLDQQVQTQEKLVESLQHFPDAVDGLKSIGQATAQQTEVLGMVREQLEQTAHHEEEIVGSMNSFNKTLNQMDETSRNSTQTVSTLVERSQDSEASLRAMMERSEKRMATLTGLMGFLALAAVAFALYVVFDGKKGDAPHDAVPVTAVEEPAAEILPVVDEPEVVPAPDIEEPEASEPEALVEPAEEPEVIEEIPEPEMEPAEEPEAIEGEEVETEVEPVAEPEGTEDAVEEAEVEPTEAPEVIEETTEEAMSEEGEVEILDGETAEPEALPDEESVTALDIIESPEEVVAEVEEEIEAVAEEAAEEIEESSDEDAEAEETDEVTSLEEEESAERPGVKGVVRRVFSFLGNEADAEGVEPVIGDLTDAMEVAEQVDPSE